MRSLRARALEFFVAAVVLGTLALPGRAAAFIYWGNEGTSTIGRADLDGTGAEQSFVTAGSPEGVAADGTYVYWANYNTGTIGRADFDGSGSTQSFISGASGPFGVAVGGGHIYWANVLGNTIGRADLDGTGVEQSFISGAQNPFGVAVDGHHVYWVNDGTGKIGRADLEGGEVEQSFISAPGAIAIAVDGGHLYWTNNSTGTIERANLDGSDVEPNFITGAESPQAIAVDANHVYWANYTPGTIGRANLDGTGVDRDFIGGANRPLGLAVDSLPHASATSVSCAPSPVALGASTNCTATVTDTGPFPSAPGPVAPTGTVSFSAGLAGAFGPTASCALGAVGAGESSCVLGYTPSLTGSQTITATYAGDPAHGTSSGSVAVSVGPAPAPALVLTKPSNAFELGKPKLNRKKGTATISATVPGPGSLVLTGKGIKRLAKVASRAGAVRLGLRPTKEERRRLAASGRARIKLAVTYVPSGGSPATRHKTLTLKLS